MGLHIAWPNRHTPRCRVRPCLARSSTIRIFPSDFLWVYSKLNVLPACLLATLPLSSPADTQGDARSSDRQSPLTPPPVPLYLSSRFAPGSRASWHSSPRALCILGTVVRSIGSVFRGPLFHAFGLLPFLRGPGGRQATFSGGTERASAFQAGLRVEPSFVRA